MFGFDMPSALLCPARFCTPDVVGGVVILPSMSHLVYYHHHHHHKDLNFTDDDLIGYGLNFLCHTLHDRAQPSPAQHDNRRTSILLRTLRWRMACWQTVLTKRREY
jgi:hypothetical protein